MRLMICRTVHFSGRVQGIGFRASAESIAREHDVAGTVENLPDGRVRMVVQGPSEEVYGYLASIDRELGRHVTAKDEVEVGPNERFADPHAFNAFRMLR